ncbi:hypothetical protein CC80DRAFT_548662 [Byssothecium circinans]|uniref:Zn(2)-C6 fungal-type domain-containing protein n=1 Tax=Byssothecium circinans TaxID=147558 RepID=A0A6A5TUQ0_9PLEO|nr:hypothetical protein CC80DRAFT_548662 [Byssothecium circinans]
MAFIDSGVGGVRDSEGHRMAGHSSSGRQTTSQTTAQRAEAALPACQSHPLAVLPASPVCASVQECPEGCESRESPVAASDCPCGPRTVLPRISVPSGFPGRHHSVSVSVSVGIANRRATHNFVPIHHRPAALGDRDREPSDHRQNTAFKGQRRRRRTRVPAGFLVHCAAAAAAAPSAAAARIAASPTPSPSPSASAPSAPSAAISITSICADPGIPYHGPSLTIHQGRGASHGAGGKKSEQGRHRSSIACAHCRKSKVRCSNNGINTDCELCKKNNRVCIYPTGGPASSESAVKRRPSASAGHDADGSGELPRKKSKKQGAAHIAPKGKIPSNEDLLDSKQITPQLLVDLWDIFEQHFATDLCFLHKEKFPGQLSRFNSSQVTEPFASLLLAFLALTVPFHKTFVERYWSGVTPSTISKRYADAARTRLNSNSGQSTGIPRIEKTQALLMLCLQEWRSCQGAQCFQTLATAVSCAILQNLHVQRDLNPFARATIEPGLNEATSGKEWFIEAETKRRTFWSCYIMDSYVSSGNNRPWRIRFEDIKIQLPCSEKDYFFGRNVRTMKLREDRSGFQKRRDQYYALRSSQHSVNGASHFWESSAVRSSDDDPRWEDEREQECLSWFIKALDVYRDVIWWTCNVTRRYEEKAPWDKESTFYKCEAKLDELKQNLPMDLILSETVTNSQIAFKKHRDYVLLHSIFAICDMALHREYLPGLPCGEPKPAGPIDGNIPDALNTGRPDHWYEEDAEKCFKACREFLELMGNCQDRNALVETPMTGFTLFYALQIVLWTCFFPNFDEGKHVRLLDKEDPNRKKDPVLLKNFDRAWGLLLHMRSNLRMANSWCRDARTYYKKLVKATKSYRETFGSPESNGSCSSDTMRSDHGINLWSQIEKQLKEMGDHKMDIEYKKDAEDDEVVLNIRHEDETYEADSVGAVKSEDGDARDGTPQPWNAVNNSHAPVKAQSEAGTPRAKVTNDYNGATPYTPNPSNTEYGHFAPPSFNGVHSQPPGNVYQAPESTDRETLHPPAPISNSFGGNLINSYSQAEGQKHWHDTYNGAHHGTGIQFHTFGNGYDTSIVYEPDPWQHMGMMQPNATPTYPTEYQQQ